jgi:hypothetical protein
MDREIVYPGAIPLDTDILSGEQRTMIALGYLAAMAVSSLLSPEPTVVCDGLLAQPASPTPNETVVVTPGCILGIGSTDGLSEIDSVAYGSLGTNTNPLAKMGINTAPTPLNFATLISGLTSGQFMNCLVEAKFSETDGTPIVLPYYNASNPSQPYSGPGGDGVAQNTVRAQTVTLSIKAGTVDSLAVPGPDTGYVGLWVVYIYNGQTQIVSSNITPAGSQPYIGTKLAQSRTKLTSNLTLYVSQATGASDSNSGLSTTNPFLTLQGAWAAIVDDYDLNGYSVTVDIAAGTYAPVVFAGAPPGFGTGNVITFNGAGSTTIISNSGGGSTVEAINGAIVTIQNMQIVSAGFGVVGNNGGTISMNGGMTFGACANSQVYATSGGTVNINGNETITGGSLNHYSTAAGGQIILTAGSAPTITLTGTPAFSLGFAYCRGGYIGLWNGPVAFPIFSGAATGPHFEIMTGGTLDTSGAGGSLGANLPGNSNGTFGSGTNGGFYS